MKKIKYSAFTLIRTLRRKNLISVQRGFTLIELLVVISIIGILLGLSVFGLQGARQSSRDARRRADLELIRSGLEIYKSDCSGYPTTNVTALSSLAGNGSSASCPTTNTYISKIPVDPITGIYSYSYSSNGTTYALCASLEQAPSPAMDLTGCGSCVATCNYKVSNP